MKYIIAILLVICMCGCENTISIDGKQYKKGIVPGGKLSSGSEYYNVVYVLACEKGEEVK